MKSEEIRIVLQCILFFDDGLTKSEVCEFGFNCHLVNSAYQYWESLKLTQIAQGGLSR